MEQDHIVHLLVDEIDLVIIEEHAVGGDGKAELLVVFLFHAAGILYHLLDHIKVDERLPAEEVQLQVVDGPRNCAIRKSMACLADFSDMSIAALARSRPCRQSSTCSAGCSHVQHAGTVALMGDATIVSANWLHNHPHCKELTLLA